MESPTGCCAHGGLAVKGPWLGPGGPSLALTAWTGLGNTTLTMLVGWFLPRKTGLGSEQVYDNIYSVDYCILINKWAWSSHKFAY